MMPGRGKARRRFAANMTLRLGRPMIAGRLPEIWWVVLLRAAAAAIFGVLTLIWPRHSAAVMLALFAAYAFVDGITSLFISTQGQGLRSRSTLALGGAISLAAVFFTLERPRLAALALVTIIGAWIILRGGGEIITALPERRGSVAWSRLVKRVRWSLVVNGAMSMLFGVALIVTPRLGGLALMWAVGAWAILHGLLMVPFALELRRHRPHQTGGTEFESRP